MIMIIIAMRSGDATVNLKARHCSHCFQYYLSQPMLAFFLLMYQPGCDVDG